MKISTLFPAAPAALLLATALGLPAPPAAAGEVDGAAAFEHFKALEGEWQAKNAKGEIIPMSYEVVANGSAVLERFGGEEDSHYRSMLTVYHLEGDDLVLTHYCMAGNQPKMRALAYDPESGEVHFEMVDATGLDDPAEGHMHKAVFRFTEADRHESDWTFQEGGQESFTETMTMSRAAQRAAR